MSKPVIEPPNPAILIASVKAADTDRIQIPKNQFIADTDTDIICIRAVPWCMLLDSPVSL